MNKSFTYYVGLSELAINILNYVNYDNIVTYTDTLVNEGTYNNKI